MSASCPSSCYPSVLFVFHFAAGLTHQVQVFSQQRMCVCVCVHVPITECVCVKRVSLTLSRTVCLTLSASSLLCLFFPSSPYQHSQVQPFSLPNPLLKTPQRLPKSAKPGSSCTIITSKQNMLCSERTIYTSTLRASFLSFCFQGTSFCDYCVCVWVLGGVNGWWLAGEV